jgi:hypothetical protein
LYWDRAERGRVGQTNQCGKQYPQTKSNDVTLLAIPSGSDQQSPQLNWNIHLICQIEFTAVRRQLSKFIWKLGFQVPFVATMKLMDPLQNAKFKEKTAGGSTNFKRDEQRN